MTKRLNEEEQYGKKNKTTGFGIAKQYFMEYNRFVGLFGSQR